MCVTEGMVVVVVVLKLKILMAIIIMKTKKKGTKNEKNEIIVTKTTKMPMMTINFILR
ncbi:hypothetical protein DPMN_115013 [Dreissena polymorpha]|uniref:Uncharacterized protein n=1 Tax=Dreissena polymorpha TaxID=45954 RepID=A0A9D4QT02_DREPO|nr:hypothetical protein DPMN_115013 [Dreissena polymorpha]